VHSRHERLEPQSLLVPLIGHTGVVQLIVVKAVRPVWPVNGFAPLRKRRMHS
jgi:hypothetical protein